MKARSLCHRSPLLWLALPLSAGLVAGRLGLPLPVLAGLPLAALGAAGAAVAAWRERRGWAPFLCLAMFAAGHASYGLHRSRLAAWESLPAREAVLAVQCDRVYPARNARRVSALATVVSADPHLRDLIGQPLYLSLEADPSSPRPLRSSRLEVRGVLERVPFSAQAFSFEGYLSDIGVNFRMTRGVVIREAARPGAYRRLCADIEARFHRILGLGLAERRPDLAGVLRAMMLGATSELTGDQRLLFLRSGTLHLFAISGLHIVAIALAVQGLLASMRLPRLPRALAAAAALWLYVDVTGASPSAVRAYLMVELVDLALLVRRGVNPLATLTAAWLAVLVWAPLQFFTASFQMSYGIVAALLLLGVPLAEALKARVLPERPDAPRPVIEWLRRRVGQGVDALALGAASSLVGTVAGLAFFRLLTPGAILVNLVMIPVSMLVIFSGLASLLAGCVGLAGLASVFNFSAGFVLVAMERAIALAVRLPGMWLTAEFRWSWLGAASLAGLLALALACYAREGPNRLRRWVPPFAFVALVLAAFVRSR